MIFSGCSAVRGNASVIVITLVRYYQLPLRGFLPGCICLAGSGCVRISWAPPISMRVALMQEQDGPRCEGSLRQKAAASTD